MSQPRKERRKPRVPLAAEPGVRRLKVWQFILVTIVYLVIVQGASLLLNAGEGARYAEPTTVDYLVRSYVIPVGLAIVFALAVMTYLGSWQQVFTERVRFRAWVIVIPVILFATVAIVTNYTGLGAKGMVFALLLLIATLMVGFGEELMFRGIGVVAFRQAGFSEFQVGLWTTLIFGAAHGTNIITAGPQALIQVALTSATGLVFYLILRSTGALVISMAAHGLWDFSVLSTQVNPEDPSPMANVAGVALAVMLLIALIFRRRLSAAAAKAGLSPRADSDAAAQ